MIKIYRFNDLKYKIKRFKRFAFWIKYAIIESYNCVWCALAKEKIKLMEIKL